MIEVSFEQSRSQFYMRTQCCCHCYCFVFCHYPVCCSCCFSFCYVDTMCGFTIEYLDLIYYNYTLAAARRTSMYLYIPAMHFCCCSVVCCYTAVAAAATACCCCSSSCAGRQNFCCRVSLHLIPVFSFS